MHIAIPSAVPVGAVATRVEVVVSVEPGSPGTTLHGLPEHIARETIARIAQCVTGEGLPWPRERVTIEVQPVEASKRGVMGLDLPIVVGVLAASGAVPADQLDGVAFVGEVSLDGYLRPVRSAGAIAEACLLAGAKVIVVPYGVAAEVQGMVGDRMQVLAAATLGQVVKWLRVAMPAVGTAPPPAPSSSRLPDLALLSGHPAARRAMEIAAAGDHGLLLIGCAGAPTHTLAARLPALMPPPTLDECRQMTRIASAAGVLPPGAGLIDRRPFRAPHFTASQHALVGAAGHLGRPELGEVSLAHGGVLLLCDIVEWSEATLRAVRETVEASSVPHDVRLVATTQPCPCGYLTHPERACVCSREALDAFRSRVLRQADVLGLDLAAWVQPPVSTARASRQDELTMCGRITQARRLAAEREAGDGYDDALTSDARAELERWARNWGAWGLLGDAHEAEAKRARVVRLARTIADLCAEGEIIAWSVAEATGLLIEAALRR